MHTLLVPVLLIGLFAGCKAEASGDELTSGRRSEMVVKLEGFAEQACSCKDMACAGTVRQQVQVLADGTSRVDERDFKPLQAAQARLDECLAALNPAVIEYRALTERVCECKEVACGKKVSAGFSKWASRLKSARERLPPSDAQLLVAAGTRATACLAKFDLPVPP